MIIAEEENKSEMEQLKALISELRDNRHLATISTVYAFLDEFTEALNKLIEKPFYNTDESHEAITEALSKIATSLADLKPQPMDLTVLTKNNMAIASMLSDLSKQNAEIIKFLQAPKAQDPKNGEDIKLLIQSIKSSQDVLQKIKLPDHSQVLKSIATALSAKPTEWVFDIMRLQNGKMDKVIVKSKK